MNARPILAALVLLASIFLAAAPGASAHACEGPQRTCGNCVKGEAHEHSGGEDSGCVSEGDFVADQNYNKAGLPFASTLLVLAGVVAAALVARRIN